MFKNITTQYMHTLQNLVNGILSTTSPSLPISAVPQVTEAQEKLQQLETNQRSLSSNWLTEREDLKASVDRLQSRASELEKTNSEKQRRIKELVGSGRTHR